MAALYAVPVRDADPAAGALLVWLTVAPACDGATALLRALAVAVAVAVYLVLMPSLASGSSSPWFAPVHVVILMCHARAAPITLSTAATARSSTSHLQTLTRDRFPITHPQR